MSSNLYDNNQFFQKYQELRNNPLNYNSLVEQPALSMNKVYIKRFVKQQLGIEKCHYKSDFKMLRLMYKWTREFEADRKSFESMLQNYQSKLIKLTGNTNLEFLQRYL